MPDVSAALRTQVRDRAKRRCEYCLVPESVTLIEHEIDHIIAVGAGLALPGGRSKQRPYKGDDQPGNGHKVLVALRITA